MVKASDMSAIQQKIAKLTQDVTYFERCIEVAKQHIATLQQALIALNSEPFSLATKQRGEKSKSYTYSPNEFIAKVFKRFPNQWLSTNEIMIKAFELEGYTPDKSDFHSIVIAFAHALRRLHSQGIIEKHSIAGGSQNSKNRWKLKEIGV